MNISSELDRTSYVNESLKSLCSDHDNLCKQRLAYPRNIIVGQLNVNSLRNKFESIQEMLAKNLDVLLLTETKLDESFPSAQFSVQGFKTIRKDRNKDGGGLLLYINENIASREVSIALQNIEALRNIEVLAIELNIKNTKWLLIGAYKPPIMPKDYFLNTLSLFLNKSTLNYNNILVFGDLNMTPEDNHLADFMDIFNLSNLSNKPTCFKSVNNPTCIDVFLTTKKNSFMNCSTFETGISDFHKLTSIMFRSHYIKASPKTKLYRDYKNFDEQKFNKNLKEKLENSKNLDYAIFQISFLRILNEFAPVKKKILRGNNSPFMTKTLRKAIMTRSRLRKRYTEYRSDES